MPDQSPPLAFDFSRLAGTLIVFDGPDGSGKSTQLEYLRQAVEAAGITVTRLREPGGTSIGEQIRDVLLARKNEDMDLRCEMLLYMASRAQLVRQQIRPALDAGHLVLTDRYTSSTFAYQGGGGGIPFDEIQFIADFATEKLWPTLTVLFDIPIDSAMARLHNKGPKSSRPGTDNQSMLFGDRIEVRDLTYHERVRLAYLDQATRWPDRYRLVNADQPVQDVRTELMQTLAEFFTK
jgi:dTMP kinase